MRRLWQIPGSCDVFYTEMISAEGLVGTTPYSAAYLEDAGVPERTVFQVTANSPRAMEAGIARLAQILEQRSQSSGRISALGIDLNMGCSAPEITRKGGGIHWMADTPQAARLVTTIRQQLPPGLSLSVKCRLGEEDNFPKLQEFAQALEGAGIAWLTLHPRIRKDPWGRPARKERIWQLARSSNLPIVANGDLDTVTGCLDFLQAWTEAGNTTSCPGLMLGRGALGRPWLFAEVAGAIQAKNPFLVDIQVDRLAVARDFHRLLELHLPGDYRYSRARRFHGWFASQLRFGNRLAGQLQNQPGYEALLPALVRALEDHPERYCPARVSPESARALGLAGWISMVPSAVQGLKPEAASPVPGTIPLSP